MSYRLSNYVNLQAFVERNPGLMTERVVPMRPGDVPASSTGYEIKSRENLLGLVDKASDPTDQAILLQLYNNFDAVASLSPQEALRHGTGVTFKPGDDSTISPDDLLTLAEMDRFEGEGRGDELSERDFELLHQPAPTIGERIKRFFFSRR